MIYDRLMKNLCRLKQDHGTILRMIEKCAIYGKELYDEIGDNSELDKDRNNYDDDSTFFKLLG
jgi:hypothetical protein